MVEGDPLQVHVPVLEGGGPEGEQIVTQLFQDLSNIFHYSSS